MFLQVPCPVMLCSFAVSLILHSLCDLLRLPCGLVCHQINITIVQPCLTCQFPAVKRIVALQIIGPLAQNAVKLTDSGELLGKLLTLRQATLLSWKGVMLSHPRACCFAEPCIDFLPAEFTIAVERLQHALGKLQDGTQVLDYELFQARERAMFSELKRTELNHELVAATAKLQASEVRKAGLAKTISKVRYGNLLSLLACM